KQIGLALHNYHGVYERFPPGFDSRAATVNGDGLAPGWGWASFLLPYVEQDNLFRLIDFRKDIADPQNTRPRAQRPRVFLGPSDLPVGPTFTVVGDGGAAIPTVAFAIYVGMGGTFEVTGFPDTGNGPLFRNSLNRFADITDGTSNTLMVTERQS